MSAWYARSEGVARIRSPKRRIARAAWAGSSWPVLEVREPSLLRFSWIGEEGGKPTYVTYHIEPHDGGTRFTFDHTGFTGPGGFFMAKLLGSVRKKMLAVGLRAVLDDLHDTGTLRTTSTLPASPPN